MNRLCRSNASWSRASRPLKAAPRSWISSPVSGHGQAPVEFLRAHRPGGGGHPRHGDHRASAEPAPSAAAASQSPSEIPPEYQARSRSAARSARGRGPRSGPGRHGTARRPSRPRPGAARGGPAPRPARGAPGRRRRRSPTGAARRGRQRGDRRVFARSRGWDRATMSPRPSRTAQRNGPPETWPRLTCRWVGSHSRPCSSNSTAAISVPRAAPRRSLAWRSRRVPRQRVQRQERAAEHQRQRPQEEGRQPVRQAHDTPPPAEPGGSPNR